LRIEDAAERFRVVHRRRDRRGSLGERGRLHQLEAEHHHQFGKQNARDDETQRRILDEARAQLREIDVEHHDDEQEQHRHRADVHDDQQHGQELRAEQNEQARRVEERQDQEQHRVDRVLRQDD